MTHDTAPDSAPNAAHDAAGETEEGFTHLRACLHGELTLPHEEGWEAARIGWQLLADQRPAAVVDAADVHDVVETVLAARRLGLAVAPQATGHAATALPALGDVILLHTARLHEVRVDPTAHTARVGAGARWGAVVAAAAEHGLVAVAGMSPTVGVTGFLLGGGLGWLARSHGLGANDVRALEAVDSAGRIIAVDAETDPDLLWAARGGAFPAVVTALEVQLHPAPELHAGALTWPIERAHEVVHGWREWIAALPESVTSVARVLRFPPSPQVPEHLRGRAFVVVEAAIQEDAAATERLLAPLRGLAPVADTVAATTPVGLGSLHGDPEDPSPAWGESLLLGSISPEAVDALLDAALAEGAPFVSVELRHLGGAVAAGRRPAGDAADATDGAVASLPAEGLVYAVSIVPAPGALGPVREASRLLVERMAPYALPRVAKTFAERAEPAERLYGDAADRLRRIAAERDPSGIIRSGHPLA